MAVVAETAPARSAPGWVVVLQQELRDLWLGGRGLLLSFGFSLLLSAIAYLMATNTDLNFLERREAVSLTLQVAIGLGSLLALLAGADAVSGERVAIRIEVCAVTIVGQEIADDALVLRAGKDIVGRNRWGLSVFSGDLTRWTMVGGRAGAAGSFADVTSSDCPFSRSGASGAGSGDCLGSSPSYYETLRGANIDGLEGDDLIVRASDGLRVRLLDTGDPLFESNPTLTDLAGGAAAIQPGEWGSIRSGDIDGSGGDEVLALDAQGLQAWSYDRNDRVWNKLQPSTPLALAGDPWLSHPEYYSTLQTGDVDGDGRDDVVARGPTGVRTWFYDRRGTGGWERYLPEGYPAFATDGQTSAFAALTTLAVNERVIPDDSTSVRDAWTGEFGPDQSSLTALQQGLASIANCSGAQSGNPPRYQTCTPPPGSSGFTAADWTTVVNEMLSESYAVGQVAALFGQLQGMRGSLFLTQGAQLPDLEQDLELPAAAASRPAFDGMQLWNQIFGLAGALAGSAPGSGGAPLASAASVASALPSASPTAWAARPSACSARRKPRLGSCSHGTGPWPFQPLRRSMSSERW